MLAIILVGSHMLFSILQGPVMKEAPIKEQIVPKAYVTAKRVALEIAVAKDPSERMFIRNPKV